MSPLGRFRWGGVLPSPMASYGPFKRKKRMNLTLSKYCIDGLADLCDPDDPGESALRVALVISLIDGKLDDTLLDLYMAGTSLEKTSFVNAIAHLSGMGFIDVSSNDPLSEYYDIDRHPLFMCGQESLTTKDEQWQMLSQSRLDLAESLIDELDLIPA